MNENIFDKRRLKTFSNCKELVKSMIGTREGLIAYNEKFRLDLENTCYKASICEDLQQENKQLKEDNFRLQAKADKYKCRNDKAIKYIEKNSFGISYMEISELLEILKGSDSDE